MLEVRSIAVVVPTCNAASMWPQFAKAVQAQQLSPEQVLVVDSQSTDGTAEAAKDCGFQVERIARADFNHGRTRQLALALLPDADILVYLTQDAILAGPDALSTLLAAFSDPSIGAAFGRQLPRPSAGPIESHARLFNYSDESSVRSLESRSSLGFKAIFLSNSFAAYRRSALEAAGGFPDDVILGEDTITAAHLLLKGWRIAYVANAAAYHSHAYSSFEEFRRYFDIGVLHRQESWLREEFGRTSGEGSRFVRSEIAYLWSRRPMLIPNALWRTLLKFIGYRLGGMERWLSPRVKRRLSMHRHFWVSETDHHPVRRGAVSPIKPPIDTTN